MPRLVLLGAICGALVAALPSAAQVGSGKIAYATDSGGIYTVNPDGSGRTLFRSGGYQPRWSPDGSRLAFVASGGTENRLVVANADGSDEHLVATGGIALSRQPWSPDGARIAWSRFEPSEIYTANADGSDLRQLTTDGHVKQPPTWSPDGSTLVFADLVQQLPRWELFVVGADGAGLTQLTDGTGHVAINMYPSWSPGGSSIAFLRQTDSAESAVYVIHPDGTELHRVAETYGAFGEIAWSPDGSQIAFTSSVNSSYTRYGIGQEVFVVNADGSGEQRLTELGPRIVADVSPVWSPDGERMLFTRHRQLATMNPDGTCEEVLNADPTSTPSWQPVPGGPALGEKSCHAISVDAKVSDPLGTSARIDVTIKNEGTEPLTNIELVATPMYESLRHYSGSGCASIPGRLVCRLDRLGRGEVHAIYLRGDARRVARDQRSDGVALRATFEVTAAEQLLRTRRESDSIAWRSFLCTSRDPGRGRIDGTRFPGLPDRICGRRGRDLIHPLAGRDLVEAGNGNDVVYAVDGYLDRITCGKGRDLVRADVEDKVGRDCERIVRE